MEPTAQPIIQRRAPANVVIGPWSARAGGAVAELPVTIDERTYDVTHPLEAGREARRNAPALASRRLLAGGDAALALGGFALGFSARYVWHLGGPHEVIVPIPALTLSLLGLATVALMLCDLARGGAYRRKLSGGALEGSLAVARAITLAVAVVVVASAAMEQEAVSRLAYLYAWAAMIALVGAGRLIRSALLAGLYRRGYGTCRIAVVGATPTGKMVMQNLATHLNRGYQLVGFVAETGEAPRRFGRFKGLGTVAQIDAILKEHQIDELIVALPAASHARIAEIFAHCEQAGVAVKFVPDLFDLRLSRVRLDDMAGIPLIDVHDGHPGVLSTVLKRALDVSVAGLALAVAAPIMALTALAIRLESPGPLLFRQERLGKNGRPFTILKFRSMRADAEAQLAQLQAHNEADGPIFKMRRDPRVTRVGRTIRKLSIDELPQLWNVLRGEMSLVGPRPPLASEVEQYHDWQRRRIDTTPGITSLWGVSGRSSLDFDEMVMLDLYYIDNWSLSLDLRILLRTALTLLKPSGAY